MQIEQVAIEGRRSLVTQLYYWVLLLSFLWGLFSFLNVIWTTHKWPSIRRGRFADLRNALRQGQTIQTTTLATEIPPDCPESGLRQLSTVQLETPGELLRKIVSRADLQFTYAISGISNAATNLRRLAALQLILTAAWGCYGIANIFKETHIRMPDGIAVLFNSLSELFGIIFIGLVIFAFLYIIQWWMLALLARRERLWHSLKGHLELLTTFRP